MNRVITRCIIFVLEYKMCGFVQEVFLGSGFRMLWMLEPEGMER